jgi:hypothetical protein
MQPPAPRTVYPTMKKSWLIRDLALTLLTLCVVAWVGSYWRCLYFACESGRPFTVIWNVVGIARGRFWTRTHWPSRVDEFGLCTRPLGKDYQWGTSGFMGFSLQWGVRGAIVIPLYLPTLLSALLLWFVWRETRAKPRGFPVEPVVKSGEKQPGRNGGSFRAPTSEPSREGRPGPHY